MADVVSIDDFIGDADKPIDSVDMSSQWFVEQPTAKTERRRIVLGNMFGRGV